MIRIRTKVGNGRVFTLLFMSKWVTLMSYEGGRSKSTDAPSLLEAGENHLAYCKHLKEIYDAQRGQSAQGILHGAGYHGNESPGVSESNNGSHIEGPSGDGGKERSEVLSADHAGSGNRTTPEIQSEEPELNNGT